MRKPKSPNYYSITKNTVNNAYDYVWFKLQHCNVEKRLTFSQNWRGVQEMVNSVCNILTQIVFDEKNWLYNPSCANSTPQTNLNIMQ